MKRRATRHLQCIQKLRLRRLTIMPTTLPINDKNKGTDSIENFRQSLPHIADVQATGGQSKLVAQATKTGLVDLSLQLTA